MFSSVYSAVQQASIREYKAYWHTNFLLIIECGTRKIVILSFEVKFVSSPIL